MDQPGRDAVEVVAEAALGDEALAEARAVDPVAQARDDAAAIREAAERDAAAIRETAQREANELRARLESILGGELGEVVANYVDRKSVV